LVLVSGCIYEKLGFITVNTLVRFSINWNPKLVSEGGGVKNIFHPCEFVCTSFKISCVLVAFCGKLVARESKVGCMVREGHIM